MGFDRRLQSTRRWSSVSQRRRRAGLLIAVVGEVLLLGALALMAWGPNENLAYPPLSLVDGLKGMAAFGGVGSIFVLGAAAVVANGKRAIGFIGAGLMLAVASVIGFVGSVLINSGRCDTCDDA